MTNIISKISTSRNLYGILHRICMLIPRQIRSQTTTRKTQSSAFGFWYANIQYEVNPKPTKSHNPLCKKYHFKHRSLSSDRNEVLEVADFSLLISVFLKVLRFSGDWGQCITVSYENQNTSEDKLKETSTTGSI